MTLISAQSGNETSSSFLGLRDHTTRRTFHASNCEIELCMPTSGLETFLCAIDEVEEEHEHHLLRDVINQVIKIMVELAGKDFSQSAACAKNSH